MINTKLSAFSEKNLKKDIFFLVIINKYINLQKCRYIKNVNLSKFLLILSKDYVQLLLHLQISFYYYCNFDSLYIFIPKITAELKKKKSNT